MAIKWRDRQSSLTDRLISIDDNTRNMAVAEFQKLPEEKKTQVVSQVLETKELSDPRARRFRIYALRKFGKSESAVVSACMKALADADAAVREESVVCLMQMGEAAIPDLISSLKTSPDNRIRMDALRILEKSEEKAVARLASLLQHPSVQLPVLQTMKRMGENARAAAPSIAALLASDNSLVRLEAAETLDGIGLLKKESAPLLAKDLGTAKESYSDPQAPRPRLARLLEKIDPRRRELVDLGFDLKQPNTVVRYRAAFVLSEQNPPKLGTLEMLIDALNDKDIYIAARAMVALARIGLEKTERLKRTAYPRMRAVADRAQTQKIEGFDEIVLPALKKLSI